MSNLENKSALVTGASRGIGAAIAKRLAAEGARVAITYAKDANAAAEVVKSIENRRRLCDRNPGGRGGRRPPFNPPSSRPLPLSAAWMCSSTMPALPFRSRSRKRRSRRWTGSSTSICAACCRHASRPQASDRRRADHQHWLVRRRADGNAGSGDIRSDQGRSEDVHAWPGPRSRVARHHRQQYPARPDRYRSQSGRGRLGCAADREHRAEAVRPRRRHRRDGRFRRKSGRPATSPARSLTVDGGTNA